MMRMSRIWQFLRRGLRRVSPSPEAFRQVNTERMRHRRELARSEGQAGHNLTVQTTIDMARTQTWTGGG